MPPVRVAAHRREVPPERARTNRKKRTVECGRFCKKKAGHGKRLGVNQTTNDEANHDPKEAYAETERDQRADGRGRRLPATIGWISGAGGIGIGDERKRWEPKKGNAPRAEWATAAATMCAA